MDDIKAMFLRQSLLDCEETFRDAVARRDVPAWDWLVVTAANEAQAASFRAQIDRRLIEGVLPRQTKYAVIADPGGKRVGSGGATLHVMREIARAEGGETPFSMKRILVLHSGGDSQRIPQYSALGKLFARVPRLLSDGRASTLFDEFCIALSCVPARMNGGMLVMSGDVLLLFNALQIDLERAGAACLSIKAPASVGAHHGVFLSDGAGHVERFLHKQKVEALRAAGATNAQDMVDIDTGAIWLDETCMNALYGLISSSEADFARFVNDRTRLSFYGDFVYPMANGSTLELFLAEPSETAQSAEIIECRKAIFRAIGATSLSLIRLAPAEFIHFGTTSEWRALMLDGAERFGFLGWQRSVMSLGAGDGFAAINSLIHPGARIGAGTAIEDCRIGQSAVIGECCVLSGLEFDGELPPETVLHGLPIEGSSAQCVRTYGVSDNPKEAKRFGEPIDEPLWTAALHPVLCDETSQTEPRRLSLKDSFAKADLSGILDWQESLSDDIRAERVILALSQGTPVSEALSFFSTGRMGARQKAMLQKRAEAAPFPLRHRLYFALARAAGLENPRLVEDMDNACWRAVNDHLLRHAQLDLSALPSPRIAKERAEVSLPVRVNWGGGWSDTPPYCLTNGGTVLNASVLLNGKRPVRTVAERLDEPILRIDSEDLGVFRRYTRLEELSTGNPHDPHALCKAALAVCGVVPEGAVGPIAPVLERLGGGIWLKTAVDSVPKGSGLGTSSILCAAVARALSNLLGQPDDDARICSLALCMEQLMNTGGGWQDQIGGLLPGIKLTSSHPGTPQQLTWRRVEMQDEPFEELSRRHALVFTGQRRMARSILRDIMGKAVSGDPETLKILGEIQRLAVLMAFELETGDIDQFARLLREHWALSKRLDAGSSNTCIDHLVKAVDDLIDGVMICGAGGGGFISMLLRRDVDKEALAQRLAMVYQESGVQVWRAELER